MKRKLTAGALALALAAMLAACGGGSEPAAEAPAEEPAAEAPAEAEGLKIALLPKAINNPYFDASWDGAQKACEELGASCEYVGPTEATGAAQVQFIETLIQQEVDAIVVSAADSEAISPALKQAQERGITVVTYDADVSDGSARSVMIQPSSPELIGRQQVIWASEQIGGAGEIAILSAAATAENQNTWIEFMKDELTKPEYADITLVDVVYGDDDSQLSAEKAAGLMQAYPDLKAIIAPTTVGIREAAKFISGSAFKGSVAVTGLGLPSEMNEYVKDGTVTEFGLWNPVDLGYIAIYAAHLIHTGELDAAEGASFSAGSGSYEIGANNVVIVGPPFGFNAENIDDFGF